MLSWTTLSGLLLESSSTRTGTWCSSATDVMMSSRPWSSRRTTPGTACIIKNGWPKTAPVSSIARTSGTACPTECSARMARTSVTVSVPNIPPCSILTITEFGTPSMIRFTLHMRREKPPPITSASATLTSEPICWANQVATAATSACGTDTTACTMLVSWLVNAAIKGAAKITSCASHSLSSDTGTESEASRTRRAGHGSSPRLFTYSVSAAHCAGEPSVGSDSPSAIAFRMSASSTQSCISVLARQLQPVPQVRSRSRLPKPDPRADPVRPLTVLCRTSHRFACIRCGIRALR